MKKTLKKLREKPKSERQRFAFGSALIMTAFITLVWLSVAVTRFDSGSQTAQVESPFSSIKSGFQAAIGR